MSNVSVNISTNNKVLKDLQKAFGAGGFVKVGVLSAQAGRNGEDGDLINNAELGMVQEFGSIGKNIPPRSFLRMPLEEKIDEIQKVGNTNYFKKAIEVGDLQSALEAIGFKAEEIIDSAFRSGGFGQWAANKPETVARKGSSNPLIDTSQLRRSITSKAYNGKET